MKKFLIIYITLCLCCCFLFGAGTDNKKEQQTVSMIEETSLNDALQILENFSWKYEQKKIINLSNVNQPIGVPIHQLTWRKALELIAVKLSLTIEERAGVYALTNPKAPKEFAVPDETLFNYQEKQVRIKAIAFTADRAFLRSLGIDWTSILNGKVNLNIDFAGAKNVPSSMINISGSRQTTFNNQTIEVNTLLKTIESNQKGTVIAQPIISVSSGKRGFIQVGQDISVKSVDEAGNTTDKFFATGVILEVLPTIIKADTTEVIHLKINVERSSGSPGTLSTVINKSKSETELMLYNGEESVIGGLYDTDETWERGGVPILKDLPWWVFGIRYLTGYSKLEKKERELVIIIKAEIVGSALSRMPK